MGLGLESRSWPCIDGVLGIMFIAGAGKPRRVGIRGGREGGLRSGAEEERFATVRRRPETGCDFRAAAPKP
jgi:hypothetical protein